jgi:hypothetical protein
VNSQVCESFFDQIPFTLHAVEVQRGQKGGGVVRESRLAVYETMQRARCIAWHRTIAPPWEGLCVIVTTHICTFAHLVCYERLSLRCRLAITPMYDHQMSCVKAYASSPLHLTVGYTVLA